MVKYLAIVAVLGSVALVQPAEARGRRGCASCGTYVAACPGGVCYAPAPYAPMKSAATSSAPAAPVAAAPVTQPLTQPVRVSPYYTTVPRGVFGWRR